ncbi:universal stress protein [Larkinella sp. C7]|uniref:universal stress protein n=1 Tax=Larkinella sp. C7 TaxID=2576607 RepID=UPI0014861E2E|nr:universal stress protein [Larkinella sp. C7]
MKTILIPVDYSASARLAADFGLLLAGQWQARVILLHAYPVTAIPAPYTIPVQTTERDETLHQQTGEYLQEFRDDLLRRHPLLASVPVTTKVVPGSAKSVILSESTELKADFVILGTSGANTTLENWLGSVATAVTQQARCPVWVVSGTTSPGHLRSFTYFADLKGDEVDCIQRIVAVARDLDASTKVIHISTSASENQWDAEPTFEKLKEVFQGESDIHFWQLSDDHPHQKIENYIQQYSPSVVVLAHHNRSFLDTIFHKSLIRQVVLTAKMPLLIIPKMPFRRSKS